MVYWVGFFGSGVNFDYAQAEFSAINTRNAVVIFFMFFV